MTTAAGLRGRYALITGGSTGIGAAIAAASARAGANLVLVARNEARLQEIAAQSRSRFGVEVVTVVLDLADQGATAQLMDVVDTAGIEVELLVNSAGMSSRGLVAATDPAVLRRLVDLNVGALTELSTALVARMTAAGHGSIVNIASTGAYAPTPVLAAYSASKAYVLSFTRALWAETRRTGVRVVAVSPGPTRTPMNRTQGSGLREPEQVAETVLAALNGSGPVAVDGGRNRATAAVLAALPVRVTAELAMRALSR